MGLNQADRRYRHMLGLRGQWLPVFAVAIAVLLALTGDWGRELFRYDRLAIAGGELWRLVSGHFVHLHGEEYPAERFAGCPLRRGASIR